GGQPPLLNALPTGCRFNPRCQHLGPQCGDVLPELRAIEQGQGQRVACHYPLALGGQP
ncbi:oligopeptide/dipeptide ABC transporter ATP-binding protein, partial [Pseudomonas gingeri]